MKKSRDHFDYAPSLQENIIGIGSMILTCFLTITTEIHRTPIIRKSTFNNNTVDSLTYTEMTARSGDMIENNVIQYERNFSSRVIFALTIVLTMGSLANTVPAGSAAQGSFVAGLTGVEEVPPTHTNATGSASFLQPSEGNMMYELNVTGVGNVTKADVHVGKQGENGPIVVNIFTFKSSPILINGTVSEGNITSVNLQGPMKDKQLSDLIDLFEHGDTYVNVATEQNPNGEIRGQIGFAGIDESGKALGEKNITADQALQFD